MSAIQTFRHYRISQDPSGGAVEVWRSGSEVVCLAVDTLRQVFVELHVGIADPALAREHKPFQQIAQQAGQVRHPQVLTVLDSGEDEGANYYVTEFIDGERLDTYLARCNPLPIGLALPILSQLVQGLQALAPQPVLLAGLDLFNSTIQLLGAGPEDLWCKIADLALTIEPPKSALQIGPTTERIVGDAARLLYYMLTGNMTAGVPTRSESSPLAPEVSFLMNALGDPAHPHHPTSLEQLPSLIQRCLSDLSGEMARLPERLPVNLRPRLPLQTHFVSTAALAEVLSDDFLVDSQPFDALLPYRIAATTRATRASATVQVLPPERLMPRDYLRSLRTALQRINSLDHPHLLRVIVAPEDEKAEFYLEEATGRHTLASLMKLKGGCDAAETVLLLEHLLEANREAEGCGLTPVLRSPGQIHVQFTAANGEAALPDEATLRRLSLTEWPPFRLRVRTYPTTLNLTQPERFNAERLLPPGHPSTDSSSTQKQSSLLTNATTRDFALLAAALTAGNDALPDKIRQHIADHLRQRKSSQQTQPKEFIDRLAAMSDRVLPKALVARKSPSRKKAKSAMEEVSELPFATAPMFGSADESEDLLAPLPGSMTLGSESLGYAPVSATAPGFAEMLFGGQLPPEPEMESAVTPMSLFSQSPLLPPDEGEHNFLDGLRQAEPTADEDYSYLDEPSPPRGRLLLLFLLVILVAALVAGVMAHFTGRAFWLSK